MGAETVLDRYALVYDRTRRKFIPCFDDFYGTALGLLPKITRLRVLDLGAGTGLFSAMVQERFKDARRHLVDVSDAMLNQARARFGSKGSGRGQGPDESGQDVHPGRPAGVDGKGRVQAGQLLVQMV